MQAIFWLIDTVLGLLVWAVLINVILGWLIYFNVVNAYQPLVRSIGTALEQILEPLLRPFRRLFPMAGGMDFSPILLLLTIYFLRILVATSVAPSLGVYAY